VIEMAEPRDSGHVSHLFPVRSGTRDALQRHLQAKGIETLVHYPRTLADQPVFAGYRRGACPSATRAVGELLSLPLHPGIRDSDARRVIDAIGHFANF
jgi:perosamine synthetase